jgi:hypothetical protein
MNFPYLPPLKYHSLTPLVNVFFSLSALLNLLEILYPLIHVIKCLHHNTDSQNLIFPIAHSLSLSLSILMRFLCTISLKFPHSSLTPYLLFLINSSFHTSFLFVFSSPKISYKDCATTDGRYMFMFTDSVRTQPFIHLCLGPKWCISIS